MSNHGNVFSNKTHRLLTPCLDKYGYLVVTLSTKNNKYVKKVHRLVLENFSFVVFIDTDMTQVNHIDGVKTNNCLDNLEWSNNQKQQIHANKLGLVNHVRGEQSNLNKYKESTIREICEMLELKKDSVLISSKTNVSVKFVGRIRRKERWKHVVKDYNF